MELGIVGLGILLGIFWLWYKAILRLPLASRALYMALLGAVAVMNFLSNSYLSRFGLGQLLSMVMIGIHVVPVTQPIRTYLGEWRAQTRYGPAGPSQG